MKTANHLLAPIGEHILPIETWTPTNAAPNEEFEYIDIASVDRECKRITNANQLLTTDAPSRARQIVRDGDVLVSTVRPNLNAVAMVPAHLSDAIASTGFCVLRCHPQTLDRNYLFHWVRTAAFVNDMIRKATGASYPAVSDRIIKESQIPLPPLSEQKRIADILDKADAIRRKRQEAIGLTEQLIRSAFLDMFGDPVANQRQWPVKKLHDISTRIMSGTTPKGGKQVYPEEGITFFRSQNVWRNRIVLDDIAYIDEDTHRKMARSSLRKKDILITKTGRFNTENSSLGRAAMFMGQDDSANINGHVYLVRLEAEAIHEFVLFALTMDEYREYIRRVCVGGIDKRQINKEHLEEFPIISPPRDLQIRFAAVVKSHERQSEQMKTQLAEANDLFNSLVQLAFKGGCDA